MNLSRILSGIGLIALVGAGCSDTPLDLSENKLTVLLTDAPWPHDEVARVDMFVVRIDAKRVDADSADAADTTNNGGWVTVATPNQSIDLLSLRNGVTANLGTGGLVSGIYRSFRLILDTDRSSVTLTDGTVLSGTSNPGIVFPSAGRTGIKVILDEPIDVTMDSSVMVLDFDVAQSFVLRGNNINQNGLLFKPVIRAVARETTGSVAGNVKGDSAGGVAVQSSVQLLKSGTVLGDTVSANILRTTTTDANGDFRLSFVPAGSYAVRVVPLSGYNANISNGISVTAGSSTNLGTIVVPRTP